MSVGSSETVRKPVARSKLKAVAPKVAIPKKPQILIYGGPGVGKSFGATQFPVNYYIDSEGGANLPHYTSRIEAAGGSYMGQEQGSLDFDVVVNEVKALATESHHYKTLVIDSISKLWNTAILHEQIRLGDKDAYGASKKPAVQKIRNLLDWLSRLDMNVLLLAQEKELWGDKGREGFTYDCDPKVAFDLHLILRIVLQGKRRMAQIGKSRFDAFPTGETFEWSYDNFADRYGRAVMEAEAQPLALASDEQVAEVRKLLDVVKVAPDFAEKCLARGGASDWSEMDADKIAKVIESLKEKLAA